MMETPKRRPQKPPSERVKEDEGWKWWHMPLLFFIVAVIVLLATNLFAADVLVTWTAPSDDGYVGTAAQYDIRYSTQLITDANFNSATQVVNVQPPQIAGTAESLLVTDLGWSTVYWFAKKTADEVPNWSDISNVDSITTEPEPPDTIPPAPSVIFLGQNFPNPFDDYTTIEFWLPDQRHVKLEIFDVLGRRLETLANERMGAGWHMLEWRPTFPFWNLFHQAAIAG